MSRSDRWISINNMEKNYWMYKYGEIVINFYKDINNCILFYKDFIDKNEITEFVFSRLQDPYWDLNKPYIYYFTMVSNKFDFYDDLYALSGIAYKDYKLIENRKEKLERGWKLYKHLLEVEDKLCNNIDNANDEDQLNILENKLNDLRIQMESILYLFS